MWRSCVSEDIALQFDGKSITACYYISIRSCLVKMVTLTARNSGKVIKWCNV